MSPRIDSAPSRLYGTGLLDRIAVGYDRLVSTFAPVRAARNMEARMNMALASDFFSSGGYDGADRSSADMRGWNPFGSDADSASLFDLEDLRARARDADRNQPIAGGIVNTTVMNTVGIGLTPHARLDRDLLGMSEEEAAAWQKHVDWRWWLWAGSKDCDIERKLTFNANCRLTLHARCVNGEAITLLPMVPCAGLSNPLRLQAVEADRLSNPHRAPDSAKMTGGKEKDQYGAPIAYHIMRGHPGNLLYADPGKWVWDRYPAYNPETGLPNVLHYYRTERPGQSRGIPMLAPVLEPLKDIAKMSKAELKRAVVSALFTVFLKGKGGQPVGLGFGGQPMLPGSGMSVTAGSGDLGNAAANNIALGFGSVVDLGDSGQEIQLADPKLPNVNFDPFFVSCVRQIGMRIGIPFEVVIKHYTASYSAAKAAIEDAFAFFMLMRAELIEDHCDPIRAVWFAQEVAQGTIYAPGFFADPMLRALWLNCEWSGPAKPILDPVKEAVAAEKRSDLAITTLEQETAAMNGGDWNANVQQRGREEKLRRAAGLIREGDQPAASVTAEDNPDLPEGKDAA